MYSAFSLALIAAVASAIKRIEPVGADLPQPIEHTKVEPVLVNKPVGLIPDLAKDEKHTLESKDVASENSGCCEERTNCNCSLDLSCDGLGGGVVGESQGGSYAFRAANN
jgi:hypothetical protein